MLLTSILLSALFAGIVATLVAIAIEKFGGRTGGVLATVPATIVPAALGMYSISERLNLLNRCRLFPVMMVNAIFLGMDSCTSEIWFVPCWNNDSLSDNVDVDWKPRASCFE